MAFTATWLTEWPAYDARFRAAIGLEEHERVAGFIHIGHAPPMEDRPRPPLDSIVTQISGLRARPMFYEAGQRDKAKLPHDPFKAIVAPRPIGWISTRALDGRVNLAPYSFFNGFGSAPPIVGFSSDGGGKDSAAFAGRAASSSPISRLFALRDAMNATSAPLPRGESEFIPAGLTMAECRLVDGAARRRKPGLARMQGGPGRRTFTIATAAKRATC